MPVPVALTHALAADNGGGKFLVTPSVGLMIWTLLAFGTTLYVLRRWVFPRIQEQLDKRQRAIEEAIETAERTRREADQILADYRERLHEARQQAEDIITRARRAAEHYQEETTEAARESRRSCSSRLAATSRPRHGWRSSAFARRSRT